MIAKQNEFMSLYRDIKLRLKAAENITYSSLKIMLTLILASGIQQIISFIKHYKVFDPCN